MQPPTTPGSMALPERPRLGDHVVARRHLVGGSERVVLHEARAELQVVLGPREWQVLQHADGTRDLEGVRLAAWLRGRRISAAQLQEFLGRLAAMGLLGDGIAGPTSEGHAPARTDRPVRADAPLEPLPGYRLRCDGRGTCCRFYDTVLFTPAEAASAPQPGASAAGTPAGEPSPFMPARGASYELAGGWELARAVTLVDGRCWYLSPDGACSLHRGGGAAAKPAGCRRFPTTFIHDGRAVRISVRPECACVLRSAEPTDAPALPLVPETARVAADLELADDDVELLPAQVDVTASRRVSRERFRDWADAAAEFWRERWEQPLAGDGGLDTPRLLWRMADLLEARGADDAPLPGFTGAARSGGSSTSSAPWLATLRTALARLVERWQPWRGSGDVALRTARLALGATEQTLSTGGLEQAPSATPRERRAEAFTLLALVHGHLLVEQQPLSVALRDQAVRLVLARRLGAVAAELDPPWLEEPWGDEPIAVVQALLRGHELQRPSRP